MTDKINIIVDPALKAYLPKQDDDTTTALERSVLADKRVRDPIILWKREKNGKVEHVIVDGHNRWQIIQQHNVPYTTEVRDFKGLDDVHRFMLEQQLGRRNLTDTYMAELRGRYHKMVQKAGGMPGADRNNPTAKQVGDKFGKSAASIKRDTNLAGGIEAIEKEKGKAVANAIRTKEKKINRVEIEAIDKASDPEKKKELIEKALASEPGHKTKAKTPEAKKPEVEADHGKAALDAVRALLKATTPAGRKAAGGMLVKAMTKLDGFNYKPLDLGAKKEEVKPAPAPSTKPIAPAAGPVKAAAGPVKAGARSMKAAK